MSNVTPLRIRSKVARLWIAANGNKMITKQNILYKRAIPNEISKRDNSLKTIKSAMDGFVRSAPSIKKALAAYLEHVYMLAALDMF